ncbi:MAG: MATE family efflux transporter [Bacteroidales bacterium]|nr:MATE family efflux transporter [Bacteroidales bacterium]
MNSNIDLTTDKEIKSILRYSYPLFWSNIIQQIYFLVNGFLVGNYLGKYALAAIGVTYPIIFFLVSFLIGLTIGLSIIVAQYYGKKDFIKIQEVTYTILSFLLLFSIFLSACGWLFSHKLLELLNTPKDIFSDAISYFVLFCLSLPVMFLFNALSAILRGMGDSKTPMYFLISQIVLNISFDVVFILILQLPVYWLSLSIFLSTLLSLCMLIFYLNKHHEILNRRIFKLSFRWDLLKLNLKLGIPSGLQQSFVALGNIALLHLINTYGSASTAAYMITSRIDGFITIPAFVLSGGLSIFVAQNGAIGLFHRIRKGYVGMTIISASIALVLSLFCFIFRNEVMSFFNSDIEVVKVGSGYFLIVFSFYAIFFLMFMNIAILRGAGDTMTPMYITMISLLFGRIPFAYLLHPWLGLDGVWWSIPLGWILGFMISSYFVWSKKWKRKFIVRPTLPIDIS